MDIDKAFFLFSILATVVGYLIYRRRVSTQCRRSDLLWNMCGQSHDVARRAFQRRVSRLQWWEIGYSFGISLFFGAGVISSIFRVTWYLSGACFVLIALDLLLMKVVTDERKHFEAILEDGYLSGGLGSTRS